MPRDVLEITYLLNLQVRGKQMVGKNGNGMDPNIE
jgi:hypothetical protein